MDVSSPGAGSACLLCWVSGPGGGAPKTAMLGRAWWGGQCLSESWSPTGGMLGCLQGLSCKGKPREHVRVLGKLENALASP